MNREKKEAVILSKTGTIARGVSSDASNSSAQKESQICKPKKKKKRKEKIVTLLNQERTNIAWHDPWKQATGRRKVDKPKQASNAAQRNGPRVQKHHMRARLRAAATEQSEI